MQELPTIAAETQPKVSQVTKPVQSEVPKDCDHCVKGGIPMKREWLSLFTVLLLALSTVLAVLWINEKRNNLSQPASSQPASVQAEKTYSTEVPPVKPFTAVIDLPEPKIKGSMSVEEALKIRRSRRAFSEKPVSMAEISQLLWSAQGITDDKGHRTAPSARGVYPYTMYVVVRSATGIEPGLYQYLPEKHQLGNLGLANAGDLLNSAEVQEGAQKAPVVFVVSAAYGKMAVVNPADPISPTLIEAGHIGQNIYLQIESLKMSGVVMAGFSSEKVISALKLHASETAVYLVPVGHTATQTQPTE